jgi:hypothetical protein
MNIEERRHGSPAGSPLKFTNSEGTQPESTPVSISRRDLLKKGGLFTLGASVLGALGFGVAKLATDASSKPDPSQVLDKAAQDQAEEYKRENRYPQPKPASAGAPPPMLKEIPGPSPILERPAARIIATPVVEIPANQIKKT